jgi:hypothetical protein
MEPLYLFLWYFCKQMLVIGNIWMHAFYTAFCSRQFTISCYENQAILKLCNVIFYLTVKVLAAWLTYWCMFWQYYFQ